LIGSQLLPIFDEIGKLPAIFAAFGAILVGRRLNALCFEGILYFTYILCTLALLPLKPVVTIALNTNIF
jgi:hypothetical protein